jgi:hypothetical protein
VLLQLVRSGHRNLYLGGTMRRSVFAVALLLATTPRVSATEITPELKPEMRAVEVVTPTIRQDAVVRTAVAETRQTTRTTQQVSIVGDIILAALAVLGVVFILALIAA